MLQGNLVYPEQETTARGAGTNLLLSLSHYQLVCSSPQHTHTARTNSCVCTFACVYVFTAAYFAVVLQYIVTSHTPV